MTDQLSEAHSDAQIIWECIYDHGNGKFRGMKSSLQRADARRALGRLSAKATEAIRLLQEFDKAMAVAGDWPETVEETKRLKLLVDRVRFFLEPPAPPQSAEGAEHMTTPQPAALPELLREIVAYCREAGHDWSNLAEAEHMLATLQAQPAADVSSGHIKEPYTLAELNARIASNDYNAELLLQHAMLLLNAQPAEVSDATINQLVYEHTKLNPNQADDLDLLLGFRKAVRAILALRPQSYPLPDDLYDSKDWRQGNYASRVEWLHTMYEHAKQERDEYAAQLEALRPQAVPTLDLEAACIGYARLDGNEYKLASMRRNPVMDDGQLHPIYTFSDEVAEAHHGITAQGAHGGEAK